jgi:hypothetical protein
LETLAYLEVNMAKIICLFPSQAEATVALDGLTASGLPIRSEVVEGAAAEADGATLFPDDNYNPFLDVDLGDLDDEAAEYLAGRVRRGAALVVVDAPDSLAADVRALFKEWDGQLYQHRE